MTRRLVVALLILVVAAALIYVVSSPDTPAPTMNAFAERYIRLALALGQHDPDYVDAYYGPPEWRTEAEKTKVPLTDIAAAASDLAQDLPALAPTRPPRDDGDSASEDELIWLRHQYLTRQLEALRARLSMLSGRKLRFDEESKALYDAVAPTHAPGEFDGVLAELGTLLPGEGSVRDRYEAFRDRFVVPRERLDATFKAAIEGCRDRTLARLTLPAGESFTVEYVTGKSWSGYNWYQ